MDILKAPAPLATFLLRIPLAVMFLQQGLSKFPVDGAMAEMWIRARDLSKLATKTKTR